MINFIDDETKRRIKRGCRKGIQERNGRYIVRYWDGKTYKNCGTFASLYKAIRERVLYEYTDSKVYERSALLTKDFYLDKKFKESPKLRIEAAKRAALKFKGGTSIMNAAYKERISVMYLINFIRHKKCKDKINSAYDELEQFLASDKSYMKKKRIYSSDLSVHNDITILRHLLARQMDEI